MKKLILLLIISAFLIENSQSQNYKQEFNDYFTKKDTASQRLVLEKWNKSNSEDPELYIAYFNYYVIKSKSEILSIDNNPNNENALVLMDKDTSIKEPVAYMYSNKFYIPEILNKGFSKIEEGIEKNPTRLDMRFGKIYMLGQIEDYENFTLEIIKAIEYSKVIDNKWTWAPERKMEDPKNIFLKSLQSYQLQLYNTENDDLLENMKRIAEAILKIYPDHIESLTNLSIIYLLGKDYDKSLEYLKKAEKLNNEDAIVLSNIANVYKSKGDTKKAIKYYELTIKYGDDYSKKFAEEQIAELEKK